MAAALRTRTKSPLRSALIVFVGMVGLLAGLLIYLQSRHGFQHLVLPVAGVFTPGELQVRDGFLTLYPALHLEGVTYDDPKAGLSVRAERLVLAVSLMSLLAGPFPLIENLELAQAEVQVRPDTAASPPSGDQDAPGPGRTVQVIPLAVQRARVEGVTLMIQSADRVTLARDTTLEVDDLVPGGTGRFGLRSDLSIDYGTNRGRWAGGLTIAGTLDQTVTGRQVKWNATNALILREWPAHSDLPGSEAVVFDQTLSGDYDHEQARLQAFSSLAARRGERSIGAASMTFSRQAGDSGPVMEATLAIQDITAEGLNLWLDERVPLRLSAGQVTGEVQLQAVGTRYGVTSVLQGQRLVGQSEAQRTPPVDIDLQQAAAFDTGRKQLTVETFQMAVSDAGRVLLAATLDRPMALDLERGQTAAPGQGSQQAPATWTLSVQNVDIDTMRPWLTLLGKDVFKEVRTGRLLGTVEVAVLDLGAFVDLQAHLQAADVRVQGDSRGTSVGPLRFETQAQARLSNLTTLQLTSGTSTIALGTRTVGEIRATGSFDVTVPATVRTTNATLTLRNLPGEALNPLLALWSPVRVQHAKLNGTAKANVDGSLVTWEADLQGRQIRLRLPGLNAATAATDLVIAQAGRYDRSSGALRVERASVRVMERGRAVVVAALDRPLAIGVGRPQAGGETPEPSDAVEPITFTVELHRLGIDQVRSRLALWGADRLESIKAGLLDGVVQVRWQGRGDTISVDGQVAVTDFRLARGEKTSTGPVTLQTHVQAIVTRPTRVQLKDCLVEALIGKKAIAAVRVSGSADGTAGATDLALQMASVDVAALLDRFALLGKRQRQLLAGGQLTVESHLVRPREGQPLAITGTVQAHEVRMTLTEERTLTYSVDAKGDMEIDPSGTQVRIKPVGISFMRSGKPAGTVTLAGRWPLSSSGRDAKQDSGPAGELTVTVREWDSAPLADLLDLAPGRSKDPIPVIADLTLTRQSASGGLGLRGTETLGPIRVLRTDKGPTEATLHLEHDLVTRDEDVQITAFMLTAERPQGVPDRVTIQGALRFGAEPAAQVKGEVASFDAGWYTDLWSPPASAKPPAKEKDQASKGSGTSPSPEPHGGIGIPMVLDADVGVGAVVYRALTIGPGRLIAKGTGENLQVMLQPTGFAEGTVDGTVQVTRKAQEPEYTWSVKGAGLNLVTLQKAFNPGFPTRFSGTGSFTTSGTGRGEGQALKKNLSGTAVLELKDGKVAHSPLMAFLADQLNIKQLKESETAFDRIYTEVQIQDGWMRTDRVQADGSSLKVELKGGISLDGDYDARAIVKVGPALADQIKIPCVTSVLKTPDGFLTVPVEVKITGTVSEPKYAPAPSGRALAKGGTEGLLSTAAALLRGCRSESSPEEDRGPSQAPPASREDAATGLLKGLLGGEEDHSQR